MQSLATLGGAAMGALLMLGTALPSCGAQHASVSPGVSLQRILPEARFRQPVGLVPVPGTPRHMVLLEQRGVALRVDPAAPTADGTFLDLRDRVNAGGEEGLLGLAFHPAFPGNRSMYVYYSAARPRRSVLSRFTVSAGTLAADSASEAVLLEVPQPYSNHNGGQIAFGPDGMLYVALGDGGSGGDPQNNGQNRRTLLGSLLRIDVNVQGAPYAVPADNPFAGTRDGSRGEIWAYGLRNPWRFSFDRATGALYVADVGQNAMEEVNRIVRGGNYGWNVKEGTLCFNPPTGCDRPDLEPPISGYRRDQGNSITGGFVYRGRAVPALAGQYVFADFGSGRIWSIPADTERFVEPRLLYATGLPISSFGEDLQGELYVLDYGQGAVYRLGPPQ